MVVHEYKAFYSKGVVTTSTGLFEKGLPLCSQILKYSRVKKKSQLKMVVPLINFHLRFLGNLLAERI